MGLIHKIPSKNFVKTRINPDRINAPALIGVVSAIKFADFFSLGYPAYRHDLHYL